MKRITIIIGFLLLSAPGLLQAASLDSMGQACGVISCNVGNLIIKSGTAAKSVYEFSGVCGFPPGGNPEVACPPPKNVVGTGQWDKQAKIATEDIRQMIDASVSSGIIKTTSSCPSNPWANENVHCILLSTTSKTIPGPFPRSAGLITASQRQAISTAESANPPVVTTGEAGTMANLATLNGTITPNSTLPSSYYFEYGTDVTYGKTSTTESFSQTPNIIKALKLIPNLAPSTTYHYRLVFQNSSGTFPGKNMTFKTLPPQPKATTGPATSIGTIDATLTGTVNPNGVGTSFQFKWDKAGTQYYGNITPSQSAGNGPNDVPVTHYLNFLTPNTTYNYYLKATNYGGNYYEGEAKSFKTLPLIKPSVTSGPATNVTLSTATLSGKVNPNGSSTLWHHEYMKPNSTWQKTVDKGENGTYDWSATSNIWGLDPDTTYHYRIVAKNDGGTSYGPEMTFKTIPLSLPSATTGPAKNVTKTSAILEGTINPNGAATGYWFWYGTTTAYGKHTAGQTQIGGTGNVNVSDNLDGLTPNTTYHYQIMANNIKGAVYGIDKTFKTSYSPPVVTTIAPTNVTVSSATLRGTVNPNGSTTWSYFEYGPSTSYGQKANYPVLDGTGTQPVSFNLNYGLTPNTTYHFRLAASNGTVTVHGADMTFTTVASTSQPKSQPSTLTINPPMVPPAQKGMGR